MKTIKAIFTKKKEKIFECCLPESCIPLVGDTFNIAFHNAGAKTGRVLARNMSAYFPEKTASKPNSYGWYIEFEDIETE